MHIAQEPNDDAEAGASCGRRHPLKHTDYPHMSPPHFRAITASTGAKRVKPLVLNHAAHQERWQQKHQHSAAPSETAKALTTLVGSTLTPLSSISIAPPTSLIICPPDHKEKRASVSAPDFITHQVSSHKRRFSTATPNETRAVRRGKTTNGCSLRSMQAYEAARPTQVTTLPDAHALSDETVGGEPFPMR